MSESLFFTFPSIIFSIIALVGSLYFPPSANFASDASLLCCLCVSIQYKMVKKHGKPYKNKKSIHHYIIIIIITTIIAIIIILILLILLCYLLEYFYFSCNGFGWNTITIQKQWTRCHLNNIIYHTTPHNTIQYNTIQHNTIQYNTIQYNTIQYNTVQYNALHFNSMQHSAIQSVCQCLSSCFYFIITRPSFNAVESMDASTWIVEPKPRIIMRSNIYDHRFYCYQSLLLLEVEWIKSIWPFLITHINNCRFQSFVLCIPRSSLVANIRRQWLLWGPFVVIGWILILIKCKAKCNISHPWS